MQQRPSRRAARTADPAARRSFIRRTALLAGAWAVAGAAIPRAARADHAPADAASASAPASDAAPAAELEAGSDTRLALLLGNETYPAPFELLPIPKNVRDVGAALKRRGFDVTDALNLDLAASRQAMDAFAQRAAQAPANATFFFYFSGHGVQVDAANLLLPAGVNPAGQSDALLKDCLRLLTDVVGRMPQRPQTTTIAVVDACRTTLKPVFEDSGMNQVEAPPGCLIAFSTGAGKPAIAPAVADKNTFYTASLVRLMNSASEETSFAELFRLVKTDVRTTMLNFPIEAIRKLAQDPFIADNTKLRLTLAPPSQRAAAQQRFSSANESDAWAKLQQLTWPAEIAQASDDFLSKYPQSKYVAGAQVARDGALEASKLLRRSDVHLYRSAFEVSASTPADQKQDLVRAGRGDKDACARLGRLYRATAGKGDFANRYEGWLQFAAALGNGIASYDLALYYRQGEQPLLASQFEARARELGYNPPPTLDNVRK
jgi:hypothetical protein